MNVLHVVKVFMWRACHNDLATKANIFRHKITEDHLCPLCEVGVEPTRHVLWRCPAVRVIWSMCGSNIQKHCTANEEFVFIVEELQRHVTAEDMELIRVVARNLWLRRNAVVYEKMVSPYSNVISNAYDSSMDFFFFFFEMQVLENLQIIWQQIGSIAE
jgi:hypothetical protein